MCTISWHADLDGLHILCNRDEQRTREPARPPRAFIRESLDCLAPIDGRAGGTWIGANEVGLCVTLLNHHVPGMSRRKSYTSRGALVMQALAARSIAEVGEILDAQSLDNFRPFILLAFSLGSTPTDRASTPATPDSRAHRWERDGPLIVEPVERITTSSSFMSRDIIASRKKTFEHMLAANAGEVDLDLLEAFHDSHHPTKGAYSVCMHRPDAETVSHTRVHISPDEVRMTYEPWSPCQPISERRSRQPVVRSLVRRSAAKLIATQR